MRYLALLVCVAAPAWAETDVSALIAQAGLRGAEAQLAALPSPSPSESLALGGVRFLGGVERALQLRYLVGLSGGLTEMSDIPVLRLPIPENPHPAPFEPAMIEDLFAGVESDMGGALDALGRVGDGDDAGLVIDLGDLWFDIDGNGRRSPGEGIVDVAGAALGAPLPKVTVRFDTADAAWLAAYAHLLSGVSEAVQAVHPTDAIASVQRARDTFDELGRPAGDDYGFDAEFGNWVDEAAMVAMAIEGPLDAAHVRAAKAQWLGCIEENRRFWRLVARESDDDREWIPSKRQHSATGLPFPPETGAVWLQVLAEAEGVLTGRLLVPYWRVGEGAGLDLGAFLDAPPADLDLAGLIQGATLVPYLRRGPLADGRDSMLFDSLVAGDSGLYAMMIN